MRNELKRYSFAYNGCNMATTIWAYGKRDARVAARQALGVNRLPNGAIFWESDPQVYLRNGVRIDY